MSGAYISLCRQKRVWAIRKAQYYTPAITGAFSMNVSIIVYVVGMIGMIVILHWTSSVLLLIDLYEDPRSFCGPAPLRTNRTHNMSIGMKAQELWLAVLSALSTLPLFVISSFLFQMKHACIYRFLSLSPLECMNSYSTCKFSCVARVPVSSWGPCTSILPGNAMSSDKMHPFTLFHRNPVAWKKVVGCLLSLLTLICVLFDPTIPTIFCSLYTYHCLLYSSSVIGNRFLGSWPPHRIIWCLIVRNQIPRAAPCTDVVV